MSPSETSDATRGSVASPRNSGHGVRRYLPMAPALFFMVSLLGLGLWQAVRLTDPVEGDVWSQVLTSDRFWASLRYSLEIALTTTILSVLLGFMLALVVRKTVSTKAQWLQRVLVQLPLPVPHIVVGIAVIMLFGGTGFIERLVDWVGIGNPNEPDLWPIVQDEDGVGIVLAYAWKEIPFVAVMILSALRGDVGSRESVAKNLGAGSLRTLGQITLPAAAPALGFSALLVFAYTFSSFEVPMLMGRTSSEMLGVWAWRLYTDVDLSLRADAMVVGLTISLVIVGLAGTTLGLVRGAKWLGVWRDQRLMEVGSEALVANAPTKSNPAQTRPNRENKPAERKASLDIWRRRLRLPIRDLGSTLALSILIVGFFVPVLFWALGDRWFPPEVVPPDFTLRGFDVLLTRGTWRAIRDSAIIALVVTCICIALAYPVARAMTRDERLVGKRWIQLILLAPVFIPSITTSLGLHMSFLYLGFADTRTGVVFAHILPSLPYAIVTLTAAFARIPRAYEAVAHNLGASRWQTFRQVTLPMVLPGITAAAVFVFIISWSQYTSTLIIGGGVVITLPVLLFSLMSGGNLQLVAAAAIIFILPIFLLFPFTARTLDARRATGT